MTVTVVGIGGSVRAGSQSERALWAALSGAAEAGAEVHAITGEELDLPCYDPQLAERTRNAVELVEALRAADGVILVSPGYHGTISGLIKNALDYVADLHHDQRPYLDGRAVGCVGIAYGWQAAVTTLQALRTVAHALRGWPTPLGGAINPAGSSLDTGGGTGDKKAASVLRNVGRKVVEVATHRHVVEEEA